MKQKIKKKVIILEGRAIRKTFYNSPINDVAGIVSQLADPRTRFHGDEDSGGVERSVLSKRHVVRGMRLREQGQKSGREWQTTNCRSW